MFHLTSRVLNNTWLEQIGLYLYLFKHYTLLDKHHKSLFILLICQVVYLLIQKKKDSTSIRKPPDDLIR